MPDPVQPAECFVLGEWTVDPTIGYIGRGEESRRLRPLVMDLLRLLSAHQGQVVSKDALIAGVWGGAAIADSVVTSTVAELRQALDDQAQNPTYIQTIPKRGYRLLAEVRQIARATGDGGAPATPADDTSAPGLVMPPDARAPDSPAPASGGTPTGRRVLWPVAWFAAMACALAGILSVAPRRSSHASEPESSEARLVLALPKGLRIAPGNTPKVAISPDGSRVVYVGRSASGSVLYLRSLDDFKTESIAGTVGATAPFFSPSGNRIGFFAGGQLRVLPVTGGHSVHVSAAPAVFGATWISEDAIVFSGAYGEGLRQVSTRAGELRVVTTVDAGNGEVSHRWPDLVPDQRAVLFTVVRRNGNDIAAVRLDTGTRQTVLTDAMYARVLPDQVIFVRKGRLMAARFDASTLSVVGPERILTSDLLIAPNSAAADFAIARTGPLVYVPAEPEERDGELVWVDRTGHVTPVGAPSAAYMHPRLSPDDRQVLTWLRSDDEDLWLYDLASTRLQRLVTGLSGHRADWSPDGKEVVFDAPTGSSRVTLFRSPVSGAQPVPLTLPDGAMYYSSSWSPDGRHIALVRVSAATGLDIALLSRDGAFTPLVNTAANEAAPTFSPDGRWLAFVSDASGRHEVYLSRYPLNGAPVRVSTDGGREPVWSPTGLELFYRQGDAVMTVDVSPAASARVTTPRPLFMGRFDERPSWKPNYDVSRDGRFLMVRSTVDSRSGSALAVLLNWKARS